MVLGLFQGKMCLVHQSHSYMYLRLTTSLVLINPTIMKNDLVVTKQQLGQYSNLCTFVH